MTNPPHGYAESAVGRERYEWLIGATVKELGFKPGTDVLTMMWVEKDEIRAVITLRPELVYDPEHSDGSQRAD